MQFLNGVPVPKPQVNWDGEPTTGEQLAELLAHIWTCEAEERLNDVIELAAKREGWQV